MIQTQEITTENLINSLRIWAEDLTSPYSPHPKDAAYFRNIAAWIAEAATRIEKLQAEVLLPKKESDIQAILAAMSFNAPP